MSIYFPFFDLSPSFSQYTDLAFSHASSPPSDSLPLYSGPSCSTHLRTLRRAKPPKSSKTVCLKRSRHSRLSKPFSRLKRAVRNNSTARNRTNAPNCRRKLNACASSPPHPLLRRDYILRRSQGRPPRPHRLFPLRLLLSLSDILHRLKRRLLLRVLFHPGL
jgi:hypothetical protein